MAVSQPTLDLGFMTLSDFETWSREALGSFLQLRGKQVEGTFAELAAR